MKTMCLLAAIAASLTGCVTPNEMDLQAKQRIENARAACRRDSKTHLELARCENVILLADNHGPAADLVAALAAARESVAEKEDRHLMTEVEGHAELARVYSQLNTEAQQRDAASAQRAAALSEAFAVTQPPVIINQAPAPMMPAPVPTFRPTINCTSRQVWNTVQTNCN